jgi:hypothetical protein
MDERMNYDFNHREIDRLVGAMWGSTSPGSLLHNAWVAYHYHGTVLYSEKIAITRLTSSDDASGLAQAAEYLDWLKPRLAAHEGFVALLGHYSTLGIEGRFTGHDGYGGEETNWGTFVPRESLPLLERLAQERVGLTTRSERRSAEEAFRIYMARNYDKDWEENRRKLPPIDRSPYQQTSN